MAGNSDFFLNFGSNAKTWASGLSGELRPATESITSLTTALERYDNAVGQRKNTGSPIDSLFSRLDTISAQFSDMTGALSSTFEGAIKGIGLLKTDMQELLTAVRGVNEATRNTTGRGRGRPSLKTVDESDVASAAQLRNAQTLRANVGSANKQMERLADLNGRLATRMLEAGDKTVILSRNVGELLGASNRAIGGLTALEAKLSHLGENVVLNSPTGPGSVVNPGDAAGVVQQLLAGLRGMTLEIGQANIQAGRVVSQVETASKAVADSALETTRFITTASSPQAGPAAPTRAVAGIKRELPILDNRLDEPARAGTYALGNQAVTYKQSDIINGETFNQHFARVEALKTRFDEVQKRLPTARDIDPEHGPLLQKVSDAFFRSGGAHADAVTRTANRGALAQSAALTESFRANPSLNAFSSGAQDQAVLRAAEAAGLGQIRVRDQNNIERTQFDQQRLVQQALELTTTRRVPGTTDSVPGTLPTARQNVLEEFLGTELRANPSQTFAGLGNRELNRVRKQTDTRLLEVAQGQGQLPSFLADHPDPQALFAGATARSYRDEQGLETASNINAEKQARREAAQRSTVFRDTGLETDTSVNRQRLNQQYALTTQLGDAKQRRDQAQEFLETSVRDAEKARGTGGAEASKLTRDAAAQGVQNANEKVKALEEELAAVRKANASSIAATRQEAARVDATTQNTRKARALIRTLPGDVDPEAVQRGDVLQKSDAARLSEVRDQLRSSQGLLASLKQDPAAFRQRAGASLEDRRAAEKARALAEQQDQLATIDAALAKAERRLLLATEKRAAATDPTSIAKADRAVSTASTQFSKALEAKRAGVPLVEQEIVGLQPEARFRTGSNLQGPPTSAARIEKILTDEIASYTQELQTGGVTRRAFGRIPSTEERALQIQPHLEEFGIPKKEAATLARGTNAEIQTALLAAAAKMDEASVKQLQAADKAEVTANSTRTKGKNKQIAATGEDVGDVSLRSERDLLVAQHDEVLARKRVANAALKQANNEGTSTDELRTASKQVNQEFKTLNQRVAALNSEILRLEAQAAKAGDNLAATGGSGGKGGGRKPPTGGTAPPPEEPSEPGTSKTPRASIIDPVHAEILQRRLATFSQETQSAIEKARTLAGITPGTRALSATQQGHVLNAAQAFRNDPAFESVDRETARRTFGAGLGLTRTNLNNRFLVDTFKPGGLLAADPNRDRASGVNAQSNAVMERNNRLKEIMIVESVRMREALLAEFVAQERVARIEALAGDNAERLAAAKRSLSVASRNVAATALEESGGGNISQQGGLAGLLARGGQQAIRFASFQIAFTGLEKVRELVDTGIQAQTQFIRLKANLDATGKSANGLMKQLGDVSSQTAQPLAHTIQAASELTGVLKTRGDLVEGSKVASELANISHGMLTATQAAIGLRDVTDAYGLSGVKAIQGVGDMIARVSQVTGVSVHDVIEGTTQLAQEARSFGLSQRQAAVLSAEVTKNTGETGASAAEQVSRILSTLNNQKVQQVLEGTIVPSVNPEGIANKDGGKQVASQELFAEPGGVGKALTNLLSVYDQLSERQKQSIDAVVGTGRQARALTGMLRDSATSAQLLIDVTNDEGALAKQSTAFLHTLGGSLQQLGANFRRLGADMMEAHVFDILAVIIEALDKLLITADRVISGVSSVMNSNPLTANLMRMVILLGEVSLAFKLFGTAGAAALGKIGLGGVVSRIAAARPVTAAAEAGVATSYVPFARTRALGSVIGQGTRGVGGIFTPTPAQLFTNPKFNPNGAIFASEEEAATLTAQQRMASAVRTRPQGRILNFLGAPGAGALDSSVAVAGQRAAVGAEAAAARIATLGRSFAGLATATLGPLAAISALIYVFGEFQKAGANAKATREHTSSLLDEITGKSATDRKKAAEATSVDDIRDKEADAQKRRTATYNQRPGVTGFLKDMFDVPLVVSRTRNLITGDTSGGRTSNKFETDNANNYLKYSEQLDAATATKDPKKIAEAQAAVDKAIAGGAEKLVKSAGDRDAQDRAASLLWEVKQQLDDEAAKRIENLMGMKDIDILSLQQLENIQTFATKMASIDTRTLRMDPRAGQDALADTGVNPNSAIGKLAAKSLTDNTLDRVRDNVAFDKLELPQLDVQIAAKPIGDADRDRLIKARDATFANLQSQLALIDQLTINNPDAMATILQKIGDLPGATHQLNKETTAIQSVIATLDPQSPNFFQNLNLLADKNQQAADLKITPQVQGLELSNARNLNPVQQARNNQRIADLKLKAAQDAAAATGDEVGNALLVGAKKKLADALTAQKNFLPTDTRYADQQHGAGIQGPFSDSQFAGGGLTGPDAQSLATLNNNVTAASAEVKAAQAYVTTDTAQKSALVQAALVSKAQADEAVKQGLQDQAQSALALKAVILQSTGAGIKAVDAANIEKADADVAFASKTYGADSTQANNARIAAIQARMTQKQDTHDELTSAISLRAAIDANAGNNVAAAQENLKKANSDLTFAIATYGKNSKQANEARQTVVNANAANQQALDDALNASLELQISMLSNRGNDADKRQILTDKTKESQNNLNAFLARGGNKNSPEGKKLQAQVNDNRRTSIDQGAQIQIDTLEFMRETFKISASQEIAALQDMLKNKQLTQDRVRSIMLQIKNLQDANQGQFNLGDVKMPTVYDVRRTMIAGQAGAAAAASTIGYQDNKRVTIQIFGGDMPKVQAALAANLGAVATGRVTVAPKKGV